jgi:hypothetical protein
MSICCHTAIKSTSGKLYGAVGNNRGQNEKPTPVLTAWYHMLMLKSLKSRITVSIVFAALITVGVISYRSEFHPDLMVKGYSDDQGFYECSSPIKVHWSTYRMPNRDGVLNEDKVSGYLPTDTAAAQKSCRITSAF